MCDNLLRHRKRQGHRHAIAARRYCDVDGVSIRRSRNCVGEVSRAVAAAGYAGQKESNQDSRSIQEARPRSLLPCELNRHQDCEEQS